MAASAKDIKAGKAYIELTTKDRIQKGLNAAKKKLTAFSSGVASLGKKFMIAGTAAAGMAGVATAAFMKQGDELEKMSARTGASVEWLSQMKFAAQQSGAAISDIEASIKGMNKGFAEAQRGEGEFLKGIKMIGVSLKTLAPMSPAERFEYLSEKIAGIKDPAQKAKVAMLLFSEAGTKLLPMVGSIKELRAEAEKLGLTMSKEDATAAAELTDAWGRLTAMFKMFLFQIGASLAPTLKDIAEKVKVVFSAILKWVKENKETVATIAKVIVGVIAFGAALVALGGVISGVGVILGGIATAISVVGTVLGAIGSVIAFLVSPLGLVLAAVVGLTGYVLYATGAMGNAVNWLSGTWNKLKEYAGETFQGIKDAFAGGDVKLAVKILWLSIKEAFLKGVQPIKELWIGFKSMLADGWADVWWGMVDILSACLYGIKDAWSATIYWLLDLIDGSVSGIIGAWQSITAYLSEAWAACVGGIMKTWNNVMGGMMKAWVRLKGLFSDKIDVEAEVKRIDNETTNKNNAQDEATANVVKENQQRAEQHKQERERQKDANRAARKQEADQYKAEREKDKSSIEEARRQEKQANNDRYADELQGTLDAIEEARKERQAALDEAKKKAEEAKKKDNKKEPNKQDIETTIANTKGSAKGSFYANELANITASNSDAKRTADGVQTLVKKTEETNKLLKKNSSSNSAGMKFA